MLGEDHSLLNEFPEFKDIILRLVESDREFLENNQKYNELDKEIRTLELNNTPIDDAEMHQLKHSRRVLKDLLHQRLTKEKINNS